MFNVSIFHRILFEKLRDVFHCAYNFRVALSNRRILERDKYIHSEVGNSEAICWRNN